MSRFRLLLVTGKLAEPALRRTLAGLPPHVNLDFTVAVLPITVAALATTPWIASHLAIPADIDRVILPGLCIGDLNVVGVNTSATVERGPKDLRDLPDYLGTRQGTLTTYGAYDIEILAEINHVARLSREQILAQAKTYRDAGADIIDLGCDPGDPWTAAADTVKALRQEGLRVSIDSFNAQEVEAAVGAGAELVLSVNSANCRRALSWGCEVVAIPDTLANLDGLDQTVEALAAGGARFRIDPVLEPIGFGFSASLGRYLDVRRRYPEAAMMMGVGNLTELTDVDSAGVNVLLAGFCQEIGIRSILTTQVINWCRSSVRELDLARRLVHFACKEKVLPKHLAERLILLRDPRLREYGQQTLAELARQISDRNVRLFAERDLLHVMNGHMFLQGTDPFALFAQMLEQETIGPSHAFYLGYEMAKAVTALTLGKNYVQDQALDWGFLTMPEQTHQGKMTED
jgi:dihydropteroate synthase-like protein